MVERHFHSSFCGWSRTDPLVSACASGDEDAVRRLLEGWGEVISTFPFVVEGLRVACESGHEGVVRVLLEAGAHCVPIPPYSSCALPPEKLFVVACENAHAGVSKLLLEVATVPEEVLNESLFIASGRGHGAVVEMLLGLSGVDANRAHSLQCTSLYFAAQNGHREVVKLLLDAGALVNAVCDSGRNPIHIACQNGHKGVVRMLLDAGAHCDARCSYNRTPLMFALMGRRAGIAKLLIELCCDVHVVSSRGRTALITACEGALEDVVRMLLDAGVDTNVVSNEGLLPIHICCVLGHYGDSGMVSLLVSGGADISAPCVVQGVLRTPLDFSIFLGDAGVARVLLHLGCALTSERPLTSRKNHIGRSPGREGRMSATWDVLW